MATAVEKLKQAREDAITTLALEMAFEAAHGPKPDYSLDGESYQWMGYKEAMGRYIEQIDKLIQSAQPIWRASRARA